MHSTPYRCPVLHDLATQLAHSPHRLRLKQMLSIEFLLSVLESGRSYPEDFVVHGVTGFRPRLPEGAEPRLLDSDDLRADLVTLAEALSETADLSAEQWPEQVWSVVELAERFDVSTKTIFRWRRRGLVGWKFRGADRRLRLAFPDRCVRQFVARNADLVHRGSAFSQLSAAERERIVNRARELVVAGHRTVNAVARVISTENGRAVETIRLILKNHDAAEPTCGLFNRRAGHAAVDEQSLSIWEAYLDGVGLEALAERFDRPASAIYQTITRMRARELKARKIEFFHTDDFDAPDAAQQILEAPAARAPHGSAASKRPPADLPPYLQQLFRLPLLSPEGEVALFRKMNYLRYQAELRRRQIDERSTASELDRIEDLLDQAGAVKNQIVQANLRLVVSIAKRHSTPLADFFETISDGNISVMRAVDKFDFRRGFKFSTYASWAIMRNYARTVPEQRCRRERYQTGREEMLETTAAVSFEEQESDTVPAIRNLLDRMMGQLDERERAILRQRFGLDGGGEPQTLEQIGKLFGVSKERIRQLEARAMSRLRTDYEAEARQLLSL